MSLKTYSAVEVFNTSHELAANVNFFNGLCAYRWITKEPTQAVINHLLENVGLVLKDKLSNLSTIDVLLFDNFDNSYLQDTELLILQ